MWICVRSKDAQKQLARTSLILTHYWRDDEENSGVIGVKQVMLPRKLQLEYIWNLTQPIFKHGVEATFPFSLTQVSLQIGETVPF